MWKKLNARSSTDTITALIQSEDWSGSLNMQNSLDEVSLSNSLALTELCWHSMRLSLSGLLDNLIDTFSVIDFKLFFILRKRVGKWKVSRLLIAYPALLELRLFGQNGFFSFRIRCIVSPILQIFYNLSNQNDHACKQTNWITCFSSTHHHVCNCFTGLHCPKHRVSLGNAQKQQVII